MKIYARGWKRDHGAKEVAWGDVVNAIRDDDEVDHYTGGETYMRLLQPRVRLVGTDVQKSERDSEQLRVRVSMSSSQSLNLNGRYQIQCDLTKSEIADLFQLTHGSDSLDEIVSVLAKLRAKREREAQPAPLRRRRI